MIGQTIARRYLIRKFLGEGGMGEVYSAQQLGLDRDVALKVLHTELCGDESLRRRFHREARAVSRIDHPGTVRIYDFGEHRDRLYLAMELIEGCSLDQRPPPPAPQVVPRALNLASQVCHALQAAHEVGVVHRDLKPENVMVLARRTPAGDEQVKVVDFGLAAITEQSPSHLTQVGAFLGTPAYVSPEQCMGEPATPASDIYSLGVLLHYLVSGAVPFADPDPLAAINAKLSSAPPALSACVPQLEIPSALERLVLAMLAQEPQARPSLEALVLELPALEDALQWTGRYVSNRRQRATAFGLPAGAQGVPGHAADPTPGRAPQVVLWSAAAPSQDTLQAMRPHCRTLTRVETLDRLPQLMARGACDVLVADIRPCPTEETLDQLVHCQRTCAPAALVLVGPDAQLELMMAALQRGFSEYIASSNLSSQIPAALRRRGGGAGRPS